MKLLFLLSRQDIDMAAHEVLSLYKPKSYEQKDSILMFDSEEDYSNRLAFTKSVYRVLAECHEDELENHFSNIEWNEYYRGSFCVRIKSNPILEKNLAAIIYRQLDSPKVDLKAPQMMVQVFFGDKVYIALHIADPPKDYLQRKSHMRPEPHPTSLHPRLARACINMGARGGKLLDPFCGSGGILIEAGLMGFEVIGYDIDQIQLNRAEINLNSYGVKHRLEKKDALDMDEKVDCIVTDLPYGRNSKLNNKIDEMISSFLKQAMKVTDSMVLMIPDTIEIKKLDGWNLQREFSHYLHKSLTKKIVVLNKS